MTKLERNQNRVRRIQPRAIVIRRGESDGVSRRRSLDRFCSLAFVKRMLNNRLTMTYPPVLSKREG